MSATGSALGLPLEVGAAIVAHRLAAQWWRLLALGWRSNRCLVPAGPTSCPLCRTDFDREAQRLYNMWRMSRGN